MMKDKSRALDSFKIKVDILQSGAPQEYDVYPEDQDGVTYLVCLDDGIELTEIVHNGEGWSQLPNYNMTPDVVNAIGEAIESHYM